MKTLVWSYLYRPPGDKIEDRGYGPEMVKLWLNSLRQFAGYQGDIALVSNIADALSQHPELDEITIHPIDRHFENIREVQYGRVSSHSCLPAEQYDSLLYLDLDLLAVRDLSILFSTDDVLRSSTGLMPARHRYNAGFNLPQWRLNLERRLPRKWRRLGLNSCTLSVAGSKYHEYMQTWYDMLKHYEEHGRQPPPGNQCVLNIAMLEKKLPIELYSTEYVHHNRWAYTEQVRVWHFPGRFRLDDMEKWTEKYVNGDMPTHRDGHIGESKLRY